MKNIIYLAVFVAIIIGIFSLVPQNKSTDTVTNTTSPTKETTTMTADPTTFEKVSATSAVIKTDKGDITLELYPNDAPKTVMNFATLAKNGYYDNLTFHRVEPGFVIQGGDPSGNGTGGASIFGAKFEDELNPNTASYKTGYLEGVLAMANSGPNTNGSQFFIMLKDNETLPKNYTIFGRVTSGNDVVKKIAVGDTINSIEVK
ncbi:MAG: peptidylprolyl isomerase [Candidatus Berkelbacteria bacterium]|nr:peptidylprolyl isomerase [Candidatus Berkelbacteria bacterium]MCR4307946.1 peptidylprolyl isomerase [Candidatus Berkelbacteria bacterium]